MSRILGSYRFLGSNRPRWLDTLTGFMHHTEFGPDHDARAFSFRDGAWRFGRAVFTPNQVAPEASDWYVMRFIPEGVFCGEPRPASTVTTGPYTEATARLQAVNWTEKTKSRSCKVAVVQLLAGNTLTREQPPAPAPVLVWS